MSDERIDLDVLAKWMDRQGLESGPIANARQLVGGTQNVLLQFDRGHRSFVLRRGPWHLRPKSNDQLRREMRVLAALATTDVPHPGLIAACPEDDVLGGGAVFYLMEPVDGFNPTVGLPELHASTPAVRHAMGLSAVDAIATLGAVDYEAVGLGDVGKPEGFLERQVPRWLSELESYAKHDGYPGPDIPGLEEVAQWLDANLPSTFKVGLSHGDYHLANLMYRYDSPDVAAIVDWEMVTVGDPLLDLGWLLATWPEPAGSGGKVQPAGSGGKVQPAGSFSIGANLAIAGGLPTGDELIARYAERTTRDLSAVNWYEVMACFKLGIVLEGTHARAFAGKAPVAIGDMLHASTLGLFSRAISRIHASGRPAALPLRRMTGVPASAWDEFADTYESRFEPTTGFVLDRYLSFVEPGPDVVVADVGCGPGLVALACAAAGARVLALDISAPMVDRLQARAEASGVGSLVEGFVGDAAALPFDAGQCDAAVSNFGVIFCPDIAGALRELARVTKPGGKLMISAWTTEARNGWTTLLPHDYAETLGFVVKPREMYRWGSAAELEAACRDAGWIDVTIETVMAPPTVIASADGIDEVFATPPSRAALSDLSEAQVDRLLAFLMAQARDRFGDGPVLLPREAWLARGGP